MLSDTEKDTSQSKKSTKKSKQSTRKSWERRGKKIFLNMDAEPHNRDWIRNRTDDSYEALGLPNR